MAKLKSNSGAKKRFTLTGSGKIKRKHAYHSHILTKKTKKQKRNLDHFAIIEKVDVNRIKEMLVLYLQIMFNWNAVESTSLKKKSLPPKK